VNKFKEALFSLHSTQKVPSKMYSLQRTE